MLLTITGCVNYKLTPDVVNRSDAQKQQYVVLGTVKDITAVTIEGDREAGAVAGAIIGGVAGKNVTDSETESDIASLVGGLVGSAVGSEIGSNLTKKDGVELLIETDAGINIYYSRSKLNKLLYKSKSKNYKKKWKIKSFTF